MTTNHITITIQLFIIIPKVNKKIDSHQNNPNFIQNSKSNP